MADDTPPDGGVYRRRRGLFHYLKGDLLHVIDWLILKDKWTAYVYESIGNTHTPLESPSFADEAELLKWFAGEHQKLLDHGWTFAHQQVLTTESPLRNS